MIIVSDEETEVIHGSDSPFTLAVSDTTTLVTQGNEAVSYPHAAVACSGNGAPGAWGQPSNYTFPSNSVWIWETAQPVGSAADETVTFQKSFDVDFIPASAILYAVSDNRRAFWINGNYVGNGGYDSVGWNPASVWDITNLLQVGTNVLTVQVINVGPPDPGNLAGVRFQIVAQSDPDYVHPAVPTYVFPSWGYLSDFHFLASAKYIWESYYVIDPTVDATVTFQRTFALSGSVTDATLYIAADNKYTVWLNGNYIGTNTNWQTVEAYDVAAFLQQGENTLTIEGVNVGIPGSTPTQNVAMIVFQLNINGPSDTHTFPWWKFFRMCKVP